MLRTATRIALFSSLLLLLASAAPAQESGNEFHWTGTLAPDQILTIKDISGSIEATGVDGNQIVVDATKSGEDAADVHFQVIPSSDGVTICAVFPTGRGGMNSCETGRGNHSETHDVHARADFRIKVPKNLRFNAFNVNGSVNAQDLGRQADVSSVNGKVDVSTASYARATSVNGSVRVRMGSADWQDTLDIKTVNGSIDLDMPGNLAADVTFRSVNGGLTSDFPITTQEISGRWGPKRISGTIGNGGGRRLNVETVNGSVTIRKSTL
jgi:uncharacterized protein YaiE (UPF0345 family)